MFLSGTKTIFMGNVQLSKGKHKIKDERQMKPGSKLFIPVPLPRLSALF